MQELAVVEVGRHEARRIESANLGTAGEPRDEAAQPVDPCHGPAGDGEKLCARALHLLGRE